jgi:hypothetical protein
MASGSDAMFAEGVRHEVAMSLQYCSGVFARAPVVGWLQDPGLSSVVATSDYPAWCSALLERACDPDNDAHETLGALSNGDREAIVAAAAPVIASVLNASRDLSPAPVSGSDVAPISDAPTRPFTAIAIMCLLPVPDFDFESLLQNDINSASTATGDHINSLSDAESGVYPSFQTPTIGLAAGLSPQSPQRRHHPLHPALGSPAHAHLHPPAPAHAPVSWGDASLSLSPCHSRNPSQTDTFGLSFTPSGVTGPGHSSFGGAGVQTPRPSAAALAAATHEAARSNTELWCEHATRARAQAHALARAHPQGRSSDSSSGTGSQGYGDEVSASPEAAQSLAPAPASDSAPPLTPAPMRAVAPAPVPVPVPMLAPASVPAAPVAAGPCLWAAVGYISGAGYEMVCTWALTPQSLRRDAQPLRASAVPANSCPVTPAAQTPALLTPVPALTTPTQPPAASSAVSLVAGTGRVHESLSVCLSRECVGVPAPTASAPAPISAPAPMAAPAPTAAPAALASQPRRVSTSRPALGARSSPVPGAPATADSIAGLTLTMALPSPAPVGFAAPAVAAAPAAVVVADVSGPGATVAAAAGPAPVGAPAMVPAASLSPRALSPLSSVGSGSRHSSHHSHTTAGGTGASAGVGASLGPPHWYDRLMEYALWRALAQRRQSDRR